MPWRIWDSTTTSPSTAHGIEGQVDVRNLSPSVDGSALRTVAQKREGLRILRSHLGRLEALAQSAGLEALLNHDVAALKGRSLKHYEDKLDALFCAYLAA